MAVNFLHYLLQTKIECSAVSSDGYSPQNLASQCWKERNRGFMASHFIKPPVCLLFQLPFPMNVHSFVIKPKVGSQISSGIDVFVSGIKHDSLGETAFKKDRKSCQKTMSSSSDCSSFNSNIKPKTKRRKLYSGSPCTGGETQEQFSHGDEEKSKNFEAFAHKYSTLITPDSFKSGHRNLFTLVGRVNEPFGRTIRIINKRYGGKINPAIDSSGDTIIHDLFQSHTLNYVTHIVIVINRVKGSCVPGIGRLEIWGQASACCGASIKNYLSDIQKKIMQQENGTSALDRTKNSNNSTDGVSVAAKDTRKEKCIKDEDIPSEFIDPITCNLMTIPMLLPSGLNIDLSTLEKHSEAEKSWGRLPSDPFTGVLFTNEVKPLPNAALKVRIDKYILTSAVDVQGCGRTVGRSHKSTIFPNTSLKSFSLGSALNGKMSPELLQNKTKEKCIEIDKKNEKVLMEQGYHGCKKEDCVDNLSQDTKKDIVQSHEEKVSESLDSALMKTLVGASFSRRDQSLTKSAKASLLCTSSLVENFGTQTKLGTLDKTSTSKDAQHHQTSLIGSDCVGCKSTLNTLSKFQLPCQHLMCRKCLTDQSRLSKTLKCYSCGSAFRQKDVTRVHS